MAKKIFISYHHKREQKEKNILSNLISNYGAYYNLEDMSVDTGDIDSNLPSDTIYRIIREEYLKDTDVTIVILGQHTKCRKHVDREIGSSLRSYGNYNTKNGLVILLTDDFITQNGGYYYNDSFNYSQLITQQNSGQRIYDNVSNGYAVVGSLSTVCLNIALLNQLIEKAYNISQRYSPNNNAIFRVNNTENCPSKLLLF